MSSRMTQDNFNETEESCRVSPGSPDFGYDSMDGPEERHASEEIRSSELDNSRQSGDGHEARPLLMERLRKAKPDCGCSGDGSCWDRHTTKKRNITDKKKAQTVFDTCVRMMKAVDESKKPKRVYRFQSSEFVRTLLKCPDCRNLVDEVGSSLFFTVILQGRVDFLQPLFWCGALPDPRTVKIENNKNKYNGLTAQVLIDKFNLRKFSAEIESLMKVERSMTTLHKMGRDGNEEAVKYLLKHHPQMMETPAQDGSNSLMWAVTSGNLAVVKAIVGAGGDYQKATYSKETPLGRATYLGHHEIIEYLTLVLRCDPDAKCKEEETPVSIAISNLDLPTLEMLVSCRAVITNEILPVVAQSGRVDIWRFVCENVKDFDVNWKDKNGHSALFISLENGHLDIVKDIIQRRGSLTQQDRIGRNILFAAIDSTKVEVLDFVIKHLRKKRILHQLINQQDIYRGKERLFMVTGRDAGILGYHFVTVHRMYVDIFAQKIRQGGSVDVAKYGEIISSGWGTPSAEARDKINKPYEISTMDVSGSRDMTPLHYSILYRETKMASMLINAGADLNITDSFGNQPLHFAAMRGNFELVKTLEDRGVNLEFPGQLGMTANGVADANQHFKIVEYLEGKEFLEEHDKEMKDFLKQTREYLRELEIDRLHGQRRKGVSVRQFIIGKCRDINHNVSNLLYHLDSSDIQQPSD